MQVERATGSLDLVHEGGAWRTAALSRWLMTGLLFAAIAAGYALGAKIGFALTPTSQPTSTLWPPNAILMAALLILPPRLWAPLLLFVFPVHMAIEMSGGVYFLMALCWFATNSLEALIGAIIVSKFVQGKIDFGRVRDMCIFLWGGVALAPALTSFFDIGFVTLLGHGTNTFWAMWLGRTLSNAVAILVIIPSLMTVFSHKALWPLILPPGRKSEAIGLYLFLCVACVGIFLFTGIESKFPALVLFSLFPVLAWSALRFGPSFVSSISLIIAFFAIWSALKSHGPFLGGSVSENIFAVQLFCLLAGATMLLLAASISELKEAEKIAQERKAQVSLMMQTVGMDTWLWHTGSQMLEWFGPRATHFAEFRDKVERKNFFNCVHARSRDAIEEAFQRLLDTGESYSVEVQMAYFDSNYHWFECCGRALRDEDGNVCGVVGVNTNIDDRRREATKIQSQRDELAHLSRVAMLGEMSGAIAHELNQPLTAILSNSQAAQRILRRQAPEWHLMHEILEDIVSADRRAVDIIQRMRELLKKGEVNLVPIDINAIVGKVLALQHSDLILRSVLVQTHFHSTLPSVLADAVQMQQVLLNLIINACDAMQNSSANERLIRISTAFHEPDRVVISVSDHGTGIMAEPIDSIFEPFITTKSNGLGLGLPISRSIVDALHGSLTAFNNSSGGATFELMLPVAGKEFSRGPQNPVGR